jgi:hypothetical protein
LKHEDQKVEKTQIFKIRPFLVVKIYKKNFFINQDIEKPKIPSSRQCSMDTFSPNEIAFAVAIDGDGAFSLKNRKPKNTQL